MVCALGYGYCSDTSYTTQQTSLLKVIPSSQRSSVDEKAQVVCGYVQGVAGSWYMHTYYSLVLINRVLLSSMYLSHANCEHKFLAAKIFIPHMKTN